MIKGSRWLTEEVTLEWRMEGQVGVSQVEVSGGGGGVILAEGENSAYESREVARKEKLKEVLCSWSADSGTDMRKLEK